METQTGIERPDLKKIPRESNLLSSPFEEDTFSELNEGVIDPIFMPVVFTGKVLPDNYLAVFPPFSLEQSKMDSLLLNHDRWPAADFIEEEKRSEELRRRAYQYFTYNHPDQVKYKLADLPKDDDIHVPLQADGFKNLFKVDVNPDFSIFEAPEKFTFRKFWFVNGGHLLQFSQNYISKNWNKGGVGNLNILSNQNIKVTYLKEKIQFTSYLEWNTSLYTNPNDSLRKTKIGTDLLRSYSDFGIRAFNKQWYYSSNLEVKTQMLDNYSENSTVLVSSFLSPLFVNMGILGMRYELDKKYKKDKYKQFKLSIDVSPLSVKYTYVKDKEVDPKRYGIPAGDNQMCDLGSLINANMGFNISRTISFKSRFKYFTNYEKIEIESENDINFALNRYFSTRIYLYLRFDDGTNIPKDPKLGYVQLNELLSFGFNYKWN